MKINLSFHDDIILEYNKRGSPILFQISISEGDLIYPNNKWFDFGGIILGWWCNMWEELISGKTTSTMYFMDGPFKLSVSCLDKHHLEFVVLNTDSKLVFSSNLITFGKELRISINEVLRHYRYLNIAPSEMAGLEKGLEFLDTSLKALKSKSNKA